ATAAQINPRAIEFDSSGNLYLADWGNQRVREVYVTSGIINTVAGNGTQGYSGDGGAAASAEFNGPNAIGMYVPPSSGNAYGYSGGAGGGSSLYIADYSADVIRAVNMSTGVISTVAGNGTAGNTGNGGAATTAELNSPNDVTADSSGNIYIAEEGNN